MSDILADYKARKKWWRNCWQERLEENGELYGDDLQCPYCGYVIDDLADYWSLISDEGGDVDCPSCDQTFTTSVYISYTWTAKKKEDENLSHQAME